MRFSDFAVEITVCKHTQLDGAAEADFFSDDERLP